MIEDAERLDTRATLDADVCVIGAGAAGITMALSLARAGVSVILLEGGRRTAHAASQELFRGEVDDPSRHAPTDRYRRRQLGGASTIWGGQCVPFDPIDFEPRPWVDSPGWPIRYEELVGFYPEANRWCEAGDFAYRRDAAAALCPSEPMVGGWQGRDVDIESLERFSRPTDFGRRYARELREQRGLRVLLGANVIDLETTEDRSTVVSVKAATLGGRRLRVRAGSFVMATGGLETPRVLLCAMARRSLDLGASARNVGRYYMTHLAGNVGRVTLSAPSVHGYRRDDAGVYCRSRFTIAEASQRAARIGNMAARLHFTDPGDPSHRNGVLSLAFLARGLIGWEYSVRLRPDRPRPILPHVTNVIRDLPRTAAFAARWVALRRLVGRRLPSVVVEPRHGVHSLDVHAEQAPNPESRITLGAGLDRFGNPTLRVEWRHSPIDLRTVRVGVAMIATDLQRSGAGRIEWSDQSVDVEMLRHGAYGGHHIGTARMAERPEDGVVDRNCRVHGTRNLYIAGSAVFPTCGQAPPTLTIVAMALRLADHLAPIAHAAK